MNKCNPMQPNRGYTECDGLEYAKTLHIRVVGVVNDKFNSQGSVDMTFNIIPDCRDFSVSFRNQIADLSYQITESIDGKFSEVEFNPHLT